MASPQAGAGPTGSRAPAVAVQMPSVLAMPPADAYCPASLCGVVHTNSGTHPVAPVLARAVARGWEMVFLVWNGLLPFPSLCPGRRACKEMASEIM